MTKIAEGCPVRAQIDSLGTVECSKIKFAAGLDQTRTGCLVHHLQTLSQKPIRIIGECPKEPLNQIWGKQTRASRS